MSAINACRSWLLTIPADVDENGYSKEEVESLLSSYTYIGQLEQGTELNEVTGKHYLHWQVYIENSAPIRFDTLLRLFSKKGIHIERRSGTKQQAYDYVTKSDTSQGVSIKNGDIDFESDKGKRTDLQNLADDILSGMSESDVYLKYPFSSRCMQYVRKLRELYIYRTFGESLRSNLKVIYIYGLSGVGKTRYVYEKYGFSSLYRVNDYSHPFDNYDYQSVVVFDEFSSQIPVELMLTLLDIYPVQLPCRFQNKWLCADTIYILSNKSHEHQYDYKLDRNGNVVFSAEQHSAFLRRLTEVYEMNSSGVLIPRPRSPTYSYHVYDEVVDWQLQKIPDSQDLPF